jgi:hypothetical protein
MYIRWKRKERKAIYSFKGKDTLLYAVAVESKRVNGKPRQKIVKYLGSISELAQAEGNYYRMASFWNKVEKALAELAKEDKYKDQVDKLREQVKKNVPVPTAKDMEAFDKKLEEELADLNDE